jgi:hypothetical protein
MQQTEIAVFELVIAGEEFDFTIPCDSRHCHELGRGSHTADHLVDFTCGHPSYWCQERLNTYFSLDMERWQGLVRCYEGNGLHQSTMTNFTPIRQV